MAPCIFMVEDSPEVRNLVGSAIEFQGWRFGSVERVEGALDAIRKDRPDIILLDVNLPDGSGYEVCQDLRKDPALAKIPVLFLTVKGDIQSRLNGFAAGGQDYIPKPFEIAELLARIWAHLDIKQRLDELIRQNSRLTSRERVRQDLTDMIIHDLRSPLLSIKVSLRLLQESGMINDEDKSGVLRETEGTAEFMLLMLSDLLDLRAGKLKVWPEPLNLSSLLTWLERILGVAMQQKRVALQIERPESPPKILTDPMLLFRILANLVSNAYKISNSGGHVGLKICPSKEGLRFEVSDQGPGIPDSEKEKIFEKDYSFETSSIKGITGAGLGLAFCRMAVEALGGTIHVEKREAGGSRFVVNIPSRGAPVGADR